MLSTMLSTIFLFKTQANKGVRSDSVVFQDRCIRPLCHLSVYQSAYFKEILFSQDVNKASICIKNNTLLKSRKYYKNLNNSTNDSIKKNRFVIDY